MFTCCFNPLMELSISFNAVGAAVEWPGVIVARALRCCSGAAEERKRLRLELMRWHPDKFTAKFGSRLADDDKDKILARVTQISQQLNALAAT